MSDPEIVLHFREHSQRVTSSSFSKKGNILATAGEDALINIIPTFSNNNKILSSSCK